MSTTKYLSVTDTAKLVREALKAAYPGVKFSVRSHSYAGGASMNVRWTDGPVEREVDALLQRWKGATFDGMIDLKSYHSTLLANPDGTVEEVHFGADFIFADRDHSPEFLAACLDRIPEKSNAVDHRSSQCGLCGNWIPPEADQWTPGVTGSARDFSCSRHCASRILAAHVDARTMEVVSA